MDQKELLTLRERYPPGSRIVLREMKDDPFPIESGAMGTLQFIDDAGGFHTAWDNGRTLAVLYGIDSFEVTLPKMTAKKLYMPLTAELFERDESGGVQDKSITLSGSALAPYQDDVASVLTDGQTPDEALRGIMHWYGNEDTLQRKVYSMFFRPEYRAEQMWCVADCRIIEKLTANELSELKRYIALQVSSVWGEALKSRAVAGGELRVHLWQTEGWTILTEREQFGSESGKEKATSGKKRRRVR